MPLWPRSLCLFPSSSGVAAAQGHRQGAEGSSEPHRLHGPLSPLPDSIPPSSLSITDNYNDHGASGPAALARVGTESRLADFCLPGAGAGWVLSLRGSPAPLSSPACRPLSRPPFIKAPPTPGSAAVTLNTPSALSHALCSGSFWPCITKVLYTPAHSKRARVFPRHGTSLFWR